MITMHEFYQRPLWMIGTLLVLSLWTLLWKGLGLWFSAKNKQKGWFIAILILNTLGILPIIYLIWIKPSEPALTVVKHKKEKDTNNKKDVEEFVVSTADEVGKKKPKKSTKRKTSSKKSTKK